MTNARNARRVGVIALLAAIIVGLTAMVDILRGGLDVLTGITLAAAAVSALIGLNAFRASH